MPDRVTIEGYLVQSKLETALRTFVGNSWLGRELAVDGTRRRWDMAYRIENTTTVVEFDGDEHYRNSLKIKIDREKDAVAATLGYRIVRVPYWVQLTTETLRHYFQLDGEIYQDFPHGFIATKVFPASYCELGIRRFTEELEALPSSVSDAVVCSLRDRTEEHGCEYVLPESLRNLI